MPPSEIRREARESLKGKWRKAASIAFAFLAISFLVGFVQGLVGEGTLTYNLIQIAFLVINIPLSFGLLATLMKLKRNEDVSTFDFFKEGFSRFGKSWGIWFHTFIRLILPIICLVLVTFLMISLGVVNALTQSNLVLTLLGVALFIATIVYVVCRSLLYVIAYNISFDNPELSSKECVLKSAELMKGNRGNYILLVLSFIGWILLLSFGFSLGTALFAALLSYFGLLLGYILMIIGMSFLMSYMQIATICFYEKVINKKQEKIEE